MPCDAIPSLQGSQHGSKMSTDMNQSGEVLIVTGAPGAGKTTVAALVASGNAGPAVHLHADDFWHYIKTGWIAPYLPEAHQQNTVVR